jgi:hypothetical protein
VPSIAKIRATGNDNGNGNENDNDDINDNDNDNDSCREGCASDAGKSDRLLNANDQFCDYTWGGASLLVSHDLSYG